MRKKFSIDVDYIGTRLDRWIRKKISDLPQSLIEKSIRKGKIKVNFKKEKSSYKLKKNDTIILFDFNFVANKNKKSTLKYIPTKKELSTSGDMFIEDNENFVVINKPPGISVQSGTKSRRNIIDILRDTKEFENSSPYPVHRIDKETTGILLVAKNRKYAQLLTSLFRIRKIHKTYLGIVLGELKNKIGTFNDILFYYDNKKRTETNAITHYKVLDSNNSYSLLKLNPQTGRKHQLRKQLLLRGYPILGDTKYRISNNKINKNNFLMLHAYKINFSINNVRYSFVANLPFYFNKILKEKYLKISS